MNDLKVISTEIKDEEKDKEPTWISTFTQKGINLLAKLQAGTSLNITRVVSGAGYVNPDALPIQTQVTDPRKEFITGNVTYANERARIPISLDNRGVTSPYSQWQIGTYVQDPDEGEILYCISQTREPDHVPTQTQTPGWIINIGLNILYGNADRVNVTIDPTGMVSNEDMVAHELDVQAHQPAMNAHDQSEIAHAPAFLKHNTSDIAHANRFDDVYAQLGNKVNRTSPKEYSLAMSTGFSGPVKYFKTGEGVVTVYGSFLKSSGLIHDDIIGVLPVGFRISQTAEYPLVAISPYASYSLICLSNGSIVFRSSTGSTVLSQTRGYICISFVAAQ